MAYLDQEFDATTVEITNDYAPLPEGWYTAKINGADLRQTKAGNGQYIAVRYDITGPTHQGRVVWGNLNIKNPSPRAEEVGRQQLAEIMQAIGLTKVRDTDQLIGGELSIKLVIKTSEQYGSSNTVKGFKAISGSTPPAPAQQPSVDHPSQQSSGKPTPPWQK